MIIRETLMRAWTSALVWCFAASISACSNSSSSPSPTDAAVSPGCNYDVNTTTDGTQACAQTTCTPGTWCDHVLCLQGCLNKSNCAPGQYCSLAAPMTDTEGHTIGTCMTPPVCGGPVDMAQNIIGPADLAQIISTCGAVNTPCCTTGMQCTTGLMCYAAVSLCGPPCGAQGNPCCPTGTGAGSCTAPLVCNPQTGMCGTCGMAANDPCCATGTPCMGQLACSQGVCVRCGTAFADPCCTTDPACSAGLGCGTSGTCEPCGSFGQVCCSAATKCNTSFTCQANNTCQ
jgi:hypothetical protein